MPFWATGRKFRLRLPIAVLFTLLLLQFGILTNLGDRKVDRSTWMPMAASYASRSMDVNTIGVGEAALGWHGVKVGDAIAHGKRHEGICLQTEWRLKIPKSTKGLMRTVKLRTSPETCNLVVSEISESARSAIRGSRMHKPMASTLSSSWVEASHGFYVDDGAYDVLYVMAGLGFDIDPMTGSVTFDGTWHDSDCAAAPQANWWCHSNYSNDVPEWDTNTPTAWIKNVFGQEIRFVPSYTTALISAEAYADSTGGYCQGSATGQQGGGFGFYDGSGFWNRYSSDPYPYNTLGYSHEVNCF